jgi:hypothetical protein
VSNPFSNPRTSSWIERIIAATRDALQRMNFARLGAKSSRGGMIALVVCALLVGGISLAALGREGATKSAATTASAGTATKAKVSPAEKQAAENQPNSAKEEQKPDAAKDAQNQNAGQSQQSAAPANSAPFVPPPPPPQREDKDYLREREEWFLKDRRLSDGSIATGLRLKALQHVDAMRAAEKLRGVNSNAALAPTTFPGPANWTLIGPQPLITAGPGITPFNGGPNNSGRVSAIAVDPKNRDIAYLGAAAGGVWKTTNAGALWTPKTDSLKSILSAASLPTGSIGSIAIDPTLTSCGTSGPCQIIYVGTGEANNSGDSYYGVGILKSVDGGNTWVQQGASTFVGIGSSDRTDGGAHIGAMAVDPNNTQVVLAGVQFFSNPANSGIYRTTNGGTTWALVATMSGATGSAIVFDPTTAGVVYAALGEPFGVAQNGVYRSADHGATWTKLNGTGANLFPSANVGRIDIDLARSSVTTLYAAVAKADGTGLLGMFKTIDSGTNWTNLAGTPDACTFLNNGTPESQCSYDLTVRVDPNDANTVFYGGSAQTANQSNVLFRSSDGGTTWTTVNAGANGASLHADLHALAFAIPPAADRLYVGCDGGVWSTDNPTVSSPASINYTDLNSTLAITMHYPGQTADVSDENSGLVGQQDNGAAFYGGSLAWNEVLSGDGGYTAQDRLLPSTVYTTAEFISIFQSQVGGNPNPPFNAFFSFVTNGINPSDRSSFIAPLVHDESISGRLYFGTFQLYMTADAANSWNSISPDLTSGSFSSINAIAVSRSDSNVVYVGTDASGTTSRIQRTTNALSSSPTWTDLTNAATLPTSRTISSIGVDRDNPDIVYVAYSGFSGCGLCADSKGHVFRSSDGGTTWQDISGTGATALPNAPANSILVDPQLPNTVIVATDVGVFRTADASLGSGTVWATYGTGLPNVVVLGLTGRDSRIVRASTSGRSTWAIQDNNVPIPPGPVLTSLHPAIAVAGSATILGVVVDGANFTGTSQVQWNGSSTGITTHFTGNANQLTIDIDVSLLATGQVANVTVADSSQIPNLSGKLRFTVVNPLPGLTFLTPGSTNAGTSVTLTMTGSNFLCGANPTQMIFNGVFHNPDAGAVNCTPTQLIVTIPPAETGTPGIVHVSAFNPQPGGGGGEFVIGFFNFTINGVGGATAGFNPAALSFGNQATTTTSAAQTVTLTSTGVASLTTTSITKTGANSGDFVLNTSAVGACNPAGQTLTPPQSCTFAVSFAPTASGPRSASITVADNGAGSPQVINLSGTGVVVSPLSVSISPNTANFASTAVGSTSSQQLVHVTNNGTTTLNLGAQTITGTNPGDFAVVAPSTGTNCVGIGTLAVNKSCVYALTFTPLASGTQVAILNIADNAPGNPHSVSLIGPATGTGAPASMTANAGTTPQSATISTAFANALAVTVKDAGSNPVSGVNVTFTAPGAGASGVFSNATATITIATNASGIASAPFTANATAGGPYTVTAASAGLTTVNFSLTNTVGAAASMTANAGTTPQSATINTAFANVLAVTVKDVGSNPVSGVNVTFTAPGSGASGKFSNATMTITVATNASGIASAPFTANATTGGPYTVTAAATGLTTVNFSLTNTAGAATSMTANAGTTPQSATINTAFANALAVTVKDAGSNPVSGVNVTFMAPGAGASGKFSNATATITIATNASGIASASFTANATSGGPYTVTAASAGLTTVNFSLTNTAGAASTMTANAGTTPQSATISTAFSNPLAVTVKDAGSNPVSGVNVTFTAPGAGASGVFSNATATITIATNASGIASAPFTTNATAGGPYTVTAASAGLTTVNFSLTNTVGAASTMTANAGTTPQSAAINTAFANALAVTVKDAGSNPVSGVNVTFTAPGAGASGVFSNATATITVATNASGIASAPFTANAIAGGPYTVTAASAGLTTVNFSLTNLTAAPSAITPNAGTTPQSATISTTFANALAVTVKDAGSNPVSGVNVTFTAPGSGASGVFSNSSATITVATNASGIASAPFTANATAGGPYTVTAASAGLTTVNFSLTNTAGAAGSMTANAGTTPQSATISTVFANALAVTVKDAGSNPVSGVNVTFTAPGSGASGVFSNSTPTITVATNASGVASAPFTANATAGGPYTVTAASAGLTKVNFSLTNTAGAATSMTANAGTTPQSAAINTAFANALAVTVKDAGSNPVLGVNVTFTAPGSGASGKFSNATATIVVPTNASGIASAPFTANAAVGGPYAVTAAATGLTTVNFSLTNTAGPAASIVATSGTPQSSLVNSIFAPFTVKVTDAGGNGVVGVLVTWTAPSTGVSGTFAGGGATGTATTDATGSATAPNFTGNLTNGAYVVNATVPGVAAPAPFALTNTANLPTITSVSPTFAVAGGPAFTLTVNGTNFVTTSVVQFGVLGVNMPTTFVSATKLTANILASAIASAGPSPVAVFTPAPGGGNSGPTPFSINNPVPAITSIAPTSAVAGGAAFNLTVNGTGFFSYTIVNWNGANRPTTFVSSMQLTAAIPATDILTGGIATITAFNPPPVGGTSAGQPFTVNNAAPVLTSLSPTSANAGGAAFTLTVNGSKFVTGAVVSFNGAAKTTTFVSINQVTASITAADIATGGTFNVIVTNPTPTVGPSAALQFSVNNPVPTVTSAKVNGNTHASGGVALNMTIAGTNFITGATVNFGTNPAITPTAVTATQITLTIPASEVSSAGNVNVTVTNPAPGGGTTAATVFTVDGFTVSGPANTIVQAGQPANIVITITGTNPAGFANPITFAVTGLPAHSIASFSPANIPSFTTSATTTTLTIMTTAHGAMPPSAPVDTPPAPLLRLLPVLWLAAMLAGLAAMRMARRAPQWRRYASVLPLAMLLLTGAVLAGCANGKAGTPAGAAQLTITATSGTMAVSSPANSVTLTVQ